MEKKLFAFQNKLIREGGGGGCPFQLISKGGGEKRQKTSAWPSKLGGRGGGSPHLYLLGGEEGTGQLCKWPYRIEKAKKW